MGGDLLRQKGIQVALHASASAESSEPRKKKASYCRVWDKGLGFRVDVGTTA